MHQIKQLPSDFMVKEISNIEIKDKGNYLIFRLVKKDYNTLDAVKLLSCRLNVPLKNIGFAGSKDKKAITEQLISVKGVGKERVLSLELRDISLEFLGCRNEPICLGDLEGNYFEIVVRNLDSFDVRVPKRIINYFDEQRFGGNNVEVGKGLVKKDFEKVCGLLELKVKNNDFVGAIKTIPKRLLRLYVNAYQSYIWNEVVKGVVKGKIKVEEVPLIGFGTELDDYKRIKLIINKILEKEKISLDDFVIRQIPELSLEGDSRKVFAEVKDLKVLEKGDDELNSGRKKIKVCFSLGKGSYGTLVVKEIFSD